MRYYRVSLARRTQANEGDGFAPDRLLDYLLPFQRSLVDWSVRMGRAAIFAMELLRFRGRQTTGPP